MPYRWLQVLSRVFRGQTALDRPAVVRQEHSGAALVASAHVAHRHDIAEGDLAAMYALAPDKEWLAEVVSRSRSVIGFFPAHNPRALEYPWIASQLSSRKNDDRILDIGSGVNVLPFLLAERGA